MKSKESQQTTPMLNECFAVGVTSGAMDGSAPELNQDDSLREKQPVRSTAAANPQHNHADELYTEPAHNTDDRIKTR